MSPKTMRPADVLTAQKILTQKTNTMLTPENVQLHSEGAALLLIWAANMIKLYACWKKVGPPKQEVKTALKTEDMQKITNRTKVMLKNKQLGQESETKEFRAKAIKFKTEGVSATTKHEKTTGNIGTFQKTKKMIFNPESDALHAEYVDDKAQKEVKMVDLSVIKKGLNFHGTAQEKLEKEKAEIKKEEDVMEREHAMQTRSAKTHGKAEDEEDKAKSTQGSEKQEVEDEREGTLKMI